MTSIRISGFNSGLDIDSMVKTLMKAEQSKRDKLLKEQTALTWKQEAYRDVTTSLVDFRYNKLSSYSMTSALSAKKTEVTGNTAAVSVISTSSSAAGSLNVSVGNVATASQAVYSITGPTNATDNMPTGGGTLTVNGKPISYEDTETMADVVSRINSDKELNVTAIFSNGKLSITSNKTGSGNPISVSGLGAAQIGTGVTGEDAKFTVNGLEMSSSSNNVTVNGVTMLLKAESGSAGASTLTTSLDTDKILTTIKSFITDYNAILDQVNGKIQEKADRKYLPLTTDEKSAMSDKEVELWETRAKTGLLSNDSLLSSMVSDMRTAAISYYDLGVKDENGNEKMINIQSIGINTGKWTDFGKLVIEDEAKLRAAIENDPDSVVRLFTASGTSKDATSTDSGLFTKLTNIVTNTLQMVSDKAGTSAYTADKNGVFIASSMLGQQQLDLAKRISEMNDKLLRKENQYYKQFTAMETAMNRYQSQSSSLSSYL